MLPVLSSGIISSSESGGFMFDLEVIWRCFAASDFPF